MPDRDRHLLERAMTSIVGRRPSWVLVAEIEEALA
jgi:hypothetical protein